MVISNRNLVKTSGILFSSTRRGASYNDFFLFFRNRHTVSFSFKTNKNNHPIFKRIKALQKNNKKKTLKKVLVNKVCFSGQKKYQHKAVVITYLRMNILMAVHFHLYESDSF